MTTLTITPNWKNKTARFKGTIAAGEHVAVSIANDDNYITDITNLRLRVVNPANGKTLAQFPMPVEEGETPDEWDSDLTPLSCELDLNTVQMLMAVPPAANVPLLFVLDAYKGATDEDEGEFTLYFKDMCEVTHWPRRVGEEEPTNLDDYKDIIAEFREDIYGEGGFKDRVESAEASAAASAASAAAIADTKADAAATSAALLALDSTKADKSTTYTKTEVDAIVQALKTGSREIVETLPASGQPMVIYMVPKSTSQTNNAYDEYIWTAAGAWEKIGDTEIDLSGYYTKTATDTLLSGKQGTISDLSDIRSGAAAGATAYQKPSGGIPASDLAAAVQTSLGKADTALQAHQDISGKADKAVPAASGNLAALDGYGNLLDSGNVVPGTFAANGFVINPTGYPRLDINWGADTIYVAVITQGESNSGENYHHIFIPNRGGNVVSAFALLQHIAPDFSTSDTYAENDLCVYDNALYLCTTAVTSAGDWTGSTNWTAATVEDVLAALRTAVSGKQDALSAAQLANIAAVPNKADAAALRYAFAATIQPTAGTAAPTGTLTDRAGNKVVCTEATGQTGNNAKLTLTLPPAVPGYVRDFLVKIDRTTSGCYSVDFVPYGNESVSYETEDGSMPEVPDGKVTWLSFTESESGGVFTVRAIPLVAVTGGS